jgi:hypothetical protein
MLGLKVDVAFARLLAVSLAFSTSLSLPAFAETTLYINGKIYTGAGPGFAQAMAVTDEKIAAVGTTADIQKMRQNGTKVVDLHGSTVIPGFIDSHAHTLFGSMALHGLNLSTPEKAIWPDDQTDAFVAALKSFAAAHPNEKILFARANYDATKPPNHEILDRAVPDRPLIVHNVNEHSIWVNAKTLALAGVTNKPHPDAAIEAGIMRDKDGSPIGVIREGSMEIIEQPVIAALSKDEKLEMLRQGTRFLNSFGITSVVNATGNLAEIELYAALRDRKELTIRTRTAFGAIAAPHHLTPQFLNDIETARTKYHDDWVSSNLIKFFMDGASGPWPPIYTEKDFKALVSELDKRGFNIMTHALQADSAKTVLNAYEQVEQETGKNDHRFRMEHADRIMPEDMPRFAKLNVIASMQPSFCCSPANPNAKVPQDPWHTLLESGVKIAFSSDWPCTWPPSPLVGIEEATTREEWTGRGYGGAQSGRVKNGEVNTPSERLTVAQAVDAYTKGGAYASFWENKVGTLEPGKLADFAILSQDIFTVAPTEIGKTTVKETVVGGRTVYGNAL